jgi:hypothetical protein
MIKYGEGVGSHIKLYEFDSIAAPRIDRSQLVLHITPYSDTQ